MVMTKEEKIGLGILVAIAIGGVAWYLLTRPTPPIPECREGESVILEYCPDGRTPARWKVCIAGRWEEMIGVCK